MLPLLDYIITYTDEKLTSDERYYIAVLVITGGIPDPLPPGVLKVKRRGGSASGRRMPLSTLNGRDRIAL